MKKVILGAVVGAIIFFVYQSAMWMGGVHSDFSTYTPNQGAIMKTLNENLSEDGAYMIPTADHSQPDAAAAEEKLMTESVGKPWALVFYHKEMRGFEASYMIKGFLFLLVACFIVALVIYSGRYDTFGRRFGVSMAFSVFALLQCTLAEMNWWEFPWHFIKATVLDLIVGWGIVSLWLAWYVKYPPITANK